MEVYINGVLAYSAGGYLSAYQRFPLNAAGLGALKLNATNTLAVHCHQTQGGQYVDVGLDVKTVLVPAPALPPLPAWLENGSGLRGEYFNGTGFDTPVVDRTDPGINFNWGLHSPAPGVSNDLFSVRWRGQIQPLVFRGLHVPPHRR